jgi:hypothetical protein
MTRDEVVNMIRSFGDEGVQAVKDAERHFFNADSITKVLRDPERATKETVAQALKWYLAANETGERKSEAKFAWWFAKQSEKRACDEAAQEAMHTDKSDVWGG